MKRPTVDRIRGSVNIPLNQEGRAQVKKLGAKFKKNGPLDKVYSSSLSRASDTAKALGGKHIVDDNLKDMAYGKYEGEPSKTAHEEIKSYIEDTPAVKIPGKAKRSTSKGESFNGYKARLIPVLGQIEDNRVKGERLAVVLNRRSIKTVKGYASAGSPDDLNVDTKVVTGPTDDETTASVHKLSKKEGGKWHVSKVDMNKPLSEGTYLVRHGKTNWNSE
jgi:broad specificity phosphatase PhoE